GEGCRAGRKPSITLACFTNHGCHRRAPEPPGGEGTARVAWGLCPHNPRDLTHAGQNGRVLYTERAGRKDRATQRCDPSARPASKRQDRGQAPAIPLPPEFIYTKSRTLPRRSPPHAGCRPRSAATTY